MFCFSSLGAGGGGGAGVWGVFALSARGPGCLPAGLPRPEPAPGGSGRPRFLLARLRRLRRARRSRSRGSLGSAAAFTPPLPGHPRARAPAAAARGRPPPPALRAGARAGSGTAPGRGGGSPGLQPALGAAAAAPGTRAGPGEARSLRAVPARGVRAGPGLALRAAGPRSRSRGTRRAEGAQGWEAKVGRAEGRPAFRQLSAAYQRHINVARCRWEKRR